MVSEKEYVISMFEKNFSKFKSEKMAIYGLGNNTKMILDSYSDYNIVALMDQVKEGENVWGLPVVGCDEAENMGVKIVLILARTANIPIIFRRIAKKCEGYGIQVFDINGNRLENSIIAQYVCPEKYFENTKRVLLEEIKQAEVVSFDIFDTLLMRKTLYPTDIFKIVEAKAKENGVISSELDFAKIRISAERELYLEKNPTIYDIYSNMPEIITEESKDTLLKMELQVEADNLVARTGMVDIVNQAFEWGKEVCCTSDMYLPESFIKDMLHKNGYSRIEQVLVSCEYGAGKCDGLYNILKEKYSHKTILHIGDNEDADIVSARKYGINKTFKINSVLTMMYDSAVSELADYTDTLENCNFVGKFIEKQFGNPFVFERTKGKCEIKDCYELGYYFVAPVINCYMNWLLKELEDKKIETLLLGSRDGWLIKELLDMVSTKKKLSFDYKYIYTSRYSCTLAGVKNEENIKYASGLAFSGKAEALLGQRFLLNDDEIKERISGEEDTDYILRHSKLILRNAEKYKQNYIKYFKNNDVNVSGKIAFFDFVSSGTCQLWLENILEKKIYGAYFLRLFDERKKELEINSLFKTTCVYESGCRMLDNYFFMENIVSSIEPTLLYIDNAGKPQFGAETRTRKQIDDMLIIQKGIKDAFAVYLNATGDISLELADIVLSLVKSKYSYMCVDYFAGNVLKDEFCNREFELETMV